MTDRTREYVIWALLFADGVLLGVLLGLMIARWLAL